MNRRSILVEPKVYEYTLGVAYTSSNTLMIPFESLLPRHRISENFEWTNIPMPLIKYRAINMPKFEFGLMGGFPFIPFLGAAFGFANDSVTTYGSLPNAFRSGLEGKVRATETLYLSLMMMNQQFFGDQSGNINISDLRFGAQVSKLNSLEIGAKHIITTNTELVEIWDDQIDLTVNFRFNQLKHVNINPYYEFVHLISPGLSQNNISVGGLRLTWFW